MKKLLLKFADEVLSREELKSVRGASRCGLCRPGPGIVDTQWPCISTVVGCACFTTGSLSCTF